MDSHLVLYSKKINGHRQIFIGNTQKFLAPSFLYNKNSCPINIYPTCLEDPLNMSLILIPNHLTTYS